MVHLRTAVVVPALTGISSYVVGRTQFVHVGQEQSPRTDCEYGVSQGCVLGPLLFTLYISPVASVISSFRIDYAQYADDAQLYVALKDESLPALTQCIQALHHWLDCNELCLNPEKTEAVVLGTTSRQRAGQQIDTLDTGTVHIKTSDCVKSLGVLIDSTISFNQHVNKICQSSYYHIKALRHIRKLLSHDNAWTVACAMVAGRLDYCNAVLYGSSSMNTDKLQRVQNTLARVVSKTHRRDHITSVLADLHWLSVHYRIEYKIALLTYNSATAVFVRTHSSLRDSKTATTSRCQHSAVQSSSSQLFYECFLPCFTHNLE